MLRAQVVYNLAKQHYEEGSHARCYKSVWRHHVYPVYPMCYRSFLTCIHTVEKAQQEKPPVQQAVQFSLFGQN